MLKKIKIVLDALSTSGLNLNQFLEIILSDLYYTNHPMAQNLQRNITETLDCLHRYSSPAGEVDA